MLSLEGKPIRVVRDAIFSRLGSIPRFVEARDASYFGAEIESQYGRWDILYWSHNTRRILRLRLGVAPGNGVVSPVELARIRQQGVYATWDLSQAEQDIGRFTRDLLSYLPDFNYSGRLVEDITRLEAEVTLMLVAKGHRKAQEATRETMQDFLVSLCQGTLNLRKGLDRGLAKLFRKFPRPNIGENFALLSATKSCMRQRILPNHRDMIAIISLFWGVDISLVRKLLSYTPTFFLPNIPQDSTFTTGQLYKEVAQARRGGSLTREEILSGIRDADIRAYISDLPQAELTALLQVPPPLGVVVAGEGTAQDKKRAEKGFGKLQSLLLRGLPGFAKTSAPGKALRASEIRDLEKVRQWIVDWQKNTDLLISKFHKSNALGIHRVGLLPTFLKDSSKKLQSLRLAIVWTLLYVTPEQWQAKLNKKRRRAEASLLLRSKEIDQIVRSRISNRVFPSNRKPQHNLKEDSVKPLGLLLRQRTEEIYDERIWEVYQSHPEKLRILAQKYGNLNNTEIPGIAVKEVALRWWFSDLLGWPICKRTLCVQMHLDTRETCVQMVLGQKTNPDCADFLCDNITRPD